MRKLYVKNPDTGYTYIYFECPVCKKLYKNYYNSNCTLIRYGWEQDIECGNSENIFKCEKCKTKFKLINVDEKKEK